MKQILEKGDKVKVREDADFSELIKDAENEPGRYMRQVLASLETLRPGVILTIALTQEGDELDIVCIQDPNAPSLTYYIETKFVDPDN